MTRPQVLKRQVLSEKFRPDDVGVYEPSKTRKMMELELHFNKPIRDLINGSPTKVADRLGLDISTISRWQRQLYTR